jgi:hypothetical protein
MEEKPLQNPPETTGSQLPPQAQPPVLGANPKPSRKKRVLWVVAIIVIALLALADLSYWQQHKDGKKSANNSPASQPTYMAGKMPDLTPAGANDNISLQQDLDNINGSMTQSASSQSAGDKALDDKSSQIDVPTN